MAIHFFQEDIRFDLPKKLKIKRWLKALALEEGYTLSDLNFIFCSDEYLNKLNVNYLQHDTYTDIITFDTSEKEENIEGEIYISIERLKENSKIEQVDFMDETLRVLSHGLYHLCGYKDKIEREIKIMRKKEDGAILKFKKSN